MDCFIRYCTILVRVPLEPYDTTITKVLFVWIRSWAVFRIRLLIPDPDPGFSWPKIGKNLHLKKIPYSFWSEIAIHLFLDLYKGRPSYRRSQEPSALKSEQSALQNIKFLNLFCFCGSILPSWIRIWIRIPNQNPHPLTWLNPDPKHWSNGGGWGVIRNQYFRIHECKDPPALSWKLVFCSSFNPLQRGQGQILSLLFWNIEEH